MPWTNTPSARARSNRVYGTAWRKARAAALERANHRCEQCRSATRLQVDHRRPVSQGGTDQLTNLQVLCEQCHDRKTATEGGGYRKPSARISDPPARPTTTW